MRTAETAIRTVKSHSFTNENLAAGGKERERQNGGKTREEDGGHERDGSIAADNQLAELCPGV